MQDEEQKEREPDLDEKEFPDDQSEFDEQMEIAERMMRENHDVLRRLADS